MTPTPNGDAKERDLAAAACEALGRVFAASELPAQAWLDLICDEVHSVLALKDEVSGVWLSLTEGTPQSLIEPEIGVAGYADEDARDSVRSRVHAILASQPRSSYSSIAAASGATPVAVKRSSRLAVNGPLLAGGTLKAFIEDGSGGAGALTLCIEDHHGGSNAVILAQPLAKAMFSAISRAVGEQLVRPRARRRIILARLSPAQQTVLPLLLDGNTEVEIARHLERSHHTIHDHVRGIYKTLGVTSKLELMAVWNGHPLGEARPPAPAPAAQDDPMI